MKNFLSLIFAYVQTTQLNYLERIYPRNKTHQRVREMKFYPVMLFTSIKNHIHNNSWRIRVHNMQFILCPFSHSMIKFHWRKSSNLLHYTLYFHNQHILVFRLINLILQLSIAWISWAQALKCNINLHYWRIYF